ncbi:VaFE repeat-containing surface-anchored protein [Arcanobacterium phocae]|uniref:VaFE repeat-containing surface-anchored protein n=1 Tax=Arcanobacterium phocae TaxID=131112 RepID=UPI00344E4AA6
MTSKASVGADGQKEAVVAPNSKISISDKFTANNIPIDQPYQNFPSTSSYRVTTSVVEHAGTANVGNPVAEKIQEFTINNPNNGTVPYVSDVLISEGKEFVSFSFETGDISIPNEKLNTGKHVFTVFQKIEKSVGYQQWETVAEHANLEDENQTVRVTVGPEVQTKATFPKETSSNPKVLTINEGTQEAVVADMLQLQYFEKGKTYRAVAELVDSFTGKTVLATGISEPITITEDLQTAIVSIPLTKEAINKIAVNASSHYTVLERIYETDQIIDGKLKENAPIVAEHTQLDAHSQMVTIARAMPVAPKPSISTVAQVDGEKSVELDGVKPVGVVDTVKWENLPVGHYVAEATYVVDGKDESKLVVGSKSFEVTAEDAAKGSVDVALTIPESALTADGKPVKFTVLERVFKADIAGEKTGDAVAEHVDKKSVEQTVTVTVKKPVAPKPSISTVATVDGEKVVELDGVKPVEVVDTIKWENLPAGQYVAEATYVVNGGDESVVAGEQKFVVTKDQAAFGEAVVPVIVTIPESALTADGKPVKFTVLERVFKADIAGEKTGNAVAEHVDKKSVEQTVTVTVKKPVAPKPSTVTVNFSKIIAGQGDELKGAALKIVKGDKADGSDVVAEWTSTGAAKTFELNEGIYALVEDQAPLGFLKAEAITFRVTITADSKKIEILQNGAWVEAKDSTVTMEDVRDTSPKTPTPEKKQTPETPKSVPNQGGILAKTGINLAGLGIVALLFVAGGAVLRGRKKA